MNLLRVLFILGIAGVFTSAQAEDLFEDFEIKLVPKVVKETSVKPTVTFPTTTPVPVQAQAAPLNADTQSNSGNSQKVLILNQLPVSQKQNAVADADAGAENDNDFDTTVSINSKLRKERFKTERGTESTLLDRLELSRIEDEQDRADRLFGDRFSRPNPKVEVSPRAVTPKVEIIIENDGVADEVSSATELESRYQVRKRAPRATGPSNVYGGVQFGKLSYDAKDIDTNTSLGATIGIQTASNLALEASFIYAESELKSNGYNRWVRNSNSFGDYDLEQWSILLAAKYQIAVGQFSPYAGVLLGYTNRDYSDQYNSSYDRYSYGNNDYSESSKSYDYGLTFGADFRLSSSVSVGLDYKYITSFSHDQDDNNDFRSNRNSGYNRYNYNSYKKSEPLEDISYNMLSLSAKILF